MNKQLKWIKAILYVLCILIPFQIICILAIPFTIVVCLSGGDAEMRLILTKTQVWLTKTGNDFIG